MQSGKQTELERARRVLAKLREEVIVSTSIIPRPSMPEFKFTDMLKNIDKFGVMKIKKFIDCQTKLRAVRESSMAVINEKYSGKLAAPVSAQCLAITFCGVGEGQETANRLALDMMMAGCRETISLVMVEGDINERDGEPYSHIFVLIGNVKTWPETVEGLSQLGDDCLLLDAVANAVGYAKNYKALIGDEIDVHHQYRITKHQSFDPTEVDYRLVYSQAKQLAADIKADMLNKQYHSPISTLTGMVFTQVIAENSVFNLVRRQIRKMFAGSEHEASINDALSKSIEMTFRKVCAFGNEEAILFMLNNWNNLLQFNIDEPSSNGKTAAKWIDENVVLNQGQKTELKARIAAISLSLSVERQRHTMSL
jgi:hypothetical protein